MSHDQQVSGQQPGFSKDGPSTLNTDISRLESDEWADVKDPGKRRKIQNKLAQRRFRDKVREQKEETERELNNQRRAGNSYILSELVGVDQSRELSGLPWGGISIQYIVKLGKKKEQ
ncbi:hypothetical protein BS50DRAFT_445150, partial [Corynespora cassiicola Philippines]